MIDDAAIKDIEDKLTGTVPDFPEAGPTREFATDMEAWAAEQGITRSAIDYVISSQMRLTIGDGQAVVAAINWFQIGVACGRAYEKESV